MPKDSASHKRPLLAEDENEVRAGVPVDMNIEMERDFVSKVRDRLRRGNVASELLYHIVLFRKLLELLLRVACVRATRVVWGRRAGSRRHIRQIPTGPS